MACGPFQSRLALVHTPRTQGPCPGLPSQEPADLIDRRPWALARFVSGSVFEGAQRFIAGWSSPVARQAHNLKVIGSNPIPATKYHADLMALKKPSSGTAFSFPGSRSKELEFSSLALQIAFDLRVRHQDRSDKRDGAHQGDVPVEARLRAAVLEPERDIFRGAAKDGVGERIGEADAHRANFGRKHFR